MEQATTETTKRCPFCAETIAGSAVKCRFCGEWLTKSGGGATARGPYNKSQPPGHVIALSVATCGLYELYWFYRTWRDIRDVTGAPIQPGWRLVGLFIPIYNLIRLDRFFRQDIDLLRRYVGGDILIRSPLAFGLSYVLLGALFRLPNPYWILAFASVWPLAIAQGHLNVYWRQAEPALASRDAYTSGEKTLLAIGGVAWVLVAIGLLVES